MYTFTAYRSWPELYGSLKNHLLRQGDNVDTGHWQSLKGVPHTKTRELQHVAIEVPVAEDQRGWERYFIKEDDNGGDLLHGLNLSWAEDHFQERISGYPDNPGDEYRNWPWYRSGVEDHKQPGVFSHTYMERIWPKKAGGTDGRRLESTGAKASRFGGPLDTRLRTYGPHWGIRYAYGDLNDLLRLLTDEPYTRQAYLPIWFPEDLTAAAVEHERVPCTLGWHFMLRNNRLHCFYPMRSVDLYRYLPDDLYMAGRLVQWIIERLVMMGPSDGSNEAAAKYRDTWKEVRPGNLTLFASSLHVFEGDLPRLAREVKQFEKEYGDDD